jgi:hypothetical protein
MSEIQQPASEQTNPDVHHETSDANIRGVLWFALIVLVLGIVTQAVMAVLVGAMNASEDSAKPPLSPIIARERTDQVKDFIPSLDPEARRGKTEAESGRREVQPRLQSDPVDDLAILRAWEERELRKGLIPIEKAMGMLADPATAQRLGVKSRTEGRKP